MERHFDEELKKLKSDIIKMSDVVKTAINQSIEALFTLNKKQAETIITDDDLIDNMELEIDEYCIDLIAKHQPMAGDLRFITTGMKINSELERIADLSVNVAQRVLEIADKPPLINNFDHIQGLSKIAQNMIHEAIKAFVDCDIDLAKKVVKSDNEADKLKYTIQNELIHDYMEKDPSTSLRAVALLLIARHLERMCDHTTNIGEEVIYMVQGKVVRHHPEALS